MSAPDIDKFVWIASDLGKALLISIILWRRLHRTFPVFVAYLAWDLISDLLIILMLTVNHGYLIHHYAQLYYSGNIVLYLLEFCVLLEIAGNVLRPATRVISRRLFYSLLVVMLAIGIASFSLAAWVNPTPFASVRVLVVINTTAAILCLITFLLIAGFSQVLGLSWKNHVLQLATGLAFFSLVELVMELMQSQLHAGPSYLSQYEMWGRFEVIGYLLTLAFWCYAFVKKEAPRKEFSPQMTKILVSLSGSAKRQRAVLAHTRDQ